MTPRTPPTSRQTLAPQWMTGVLFLRRPPARSHLLPPHRSPDRRLLRFPRPRRPAAIRRLANEECLAFAAAIRRAQRARASPARPASTGRTPNHPGKTDRPRSARADKAGIPGSTARRPWQFTPRSPARKPKLSLDLHEFLRMAARSTTAGRPRGVWQGNGQVVILYFCQSQPGE